jgi:hypothetical protein
MNIQHWLKLSLFLTVAICAVMSCLSTLHTIWIYAQNNLTEVLNQTSNQTANQSLSPAIPGQQGGTPPKTGPS